MPTKRHALLTHPLLWGLLGITALCSLIWLVGPLLPLGDGHPLASPLNRQLAMAGCCFAWVLFQLIPRLYAGWFNRKLLRHLQPPRGDDALQATERVLTQRFNDAIQVLKRAHFTPDGQSRSGRWSRFNTQYLYQLPWYMVIGAPGAGKTTALVNSGLPFPLSETLGNAAVRGIGGTRHCDWWFTGEAVLLDTAGRYALQESMRERDASEWQRFISLLKRYRARQPINGVILTLSVADLLSDTAEMRQAQALALRQRLEELHQQIGIHFPVYLMVTKTDLLKGFMSYFAGLDKAGRQQHWGFTFPWQSVPQSRDALHARFSQGFSQMHQQLMQGLAARMAGQHELQSRADAFLFPQEFASLQPLLAEYLERVFTPEQPRLPWSPRGLFFTSGTQEGLPFDRIMGELTRKLQLPGTRSQTLASWDSVSRQAPIPAPRGQSYFIHHLLRDRVFRERGLAGSDRRWEYRHRRLHWLGYGALAAMLALLCSLWTLSYLHNRSYLARVAERLPAMQQAAMQQSRDVRGDLFALLPFLNQLIALPQSPDFTLDNPPLSLRAGLWRGEQVANASWALYQHALRALLLPRVAQSITQTLRHDNGSDDDFSRAALRAYQMLYQPRSYDGEFLRGWVMQNVQRSLPPGATPRDLQQLDWHLSQLLDKQIQSSPYARDNALMMRRLANRLEGAGLPPSDVPAPRRPITAVVEPSLTSP
ncbi:type VI secretion system membrane subunit TssM [Pantoea sp. 1.19]|uniref:type VI secretion system membrane subunit TssM n=1 Tax=Pantoea sp. 1.19 TaxID=1925589 RepID=UPI000948B04C|nr:type VI secretion system membrane subunit TssM [Pantoea sp. 1.19]